MTHDDIINLIVSLGIAIGGSLIAYLKIQMNRFITKHSSIIEQYEKTLQDSIGKTQYDSDVAVIKHAVSALNVSKEQITMLGVTSLVEELSTKVTLDKDEILKVIQKIVQGIL
jgi:hypothetical protein